VKPSAFAYHAPTALDEALELLDALGGDGKVLAGGQSLVPMMNMRLVAPPALVDITRIASLGTIEITDSHVVVGATVTHERLRQHEDAARACPLVRRALEWVAHPVIRNRGTAVGSIAHADPAAELPAVLALLDGHVDLASRRGTRRVRGGDFIVGLLESDVRPGEVVTGASWPVTPPRTGTAFHELARRHGDYALAGVGVTVGLDGDHHVEVARAAFIGVGDGPVLVDLSPVLAGQPHDALSTDAALAAAREQLDPSDDIHATGSYRRHLAGILLGRALAEAAVDATRTGVPA
jgi:aerobic carbon-monoxide dehydrogenase medium subunit